MIRRLILTSSRPFFKTLRGSIKTIEIEETYDLWVSRPVGLLFALLGQWLRLTPTQITIFATVLGIAGGCLFYFQDNPVYLWIGAGLVMWSGILDSSDGQLARMTGQSSQLGRIIDGVYGYFLFVAMHLGAAFYWLDDKGWWFIVWVFVAGFCQAHRASIYDFYKNEFMYWYGGVSSAKNDNSDQILNQFKSLRAGPKKFLMGLYLNYTSRQSGVWVRGQKMREKFEELRSQSAAFSEQYKSLFNPTLTGWALLAGDNIHRILIITFVLLGHFDYYIWVSVAMMIPTLGFSLWHRRLDQRFIQAVEGGK